MDLVYGAWSDKTKAWVDAFTMFALIFYLGVLFYGGISSAAYSLGYFGDTPFVFFKDLAFGFLTGGPSGAGEVTGFMERNPSTWRPLMWPIKSNGRDRDFPDAAASHRCLLHRRS